MNDWPPNGHGPDRFVKFPNENFLKIFFSIIDHKKLLILNNDY